MKLVFESPEATIYQGDCLEVMRTLPDASVDAVVTDPPYGLSECSTAALVGVLTAWLAGDRESIPTGRGFMGKSWDAFVPPPAVWDEAFRVLKPGGHMLVAAGSRTFDLMGLSIRLAGFEVRDSIPWLYGSGFPKSLDVAKAIDKGSGENRERQLRFTAWMRSTGITARQINHATSSFMGSHYLTDREQASIATAGMFDLIRPLLPDVPEPIERLVAERTGIEWTDYVKRPVLRRVKRTGKESGTYGAFAGDNVETAAASEASSAWQGWGTQLKPAHEPFIMARKALAGTVAANVLAHGTGALNINACRIGTSSTRRHGTAEMGYHGGNTAAEYATGSEDGRWPANVVLDESQAAALDAQSGVLTSGMMRAGTQRAERDGAIYGRLTGDASPTDTYGDSGGASRFFYTAKASSSERPSVDGVEHPTVKPLDLMRWLVRLITPPGGVILEPFAGSGTTVEAALVEGFRCIAIEREAEYLPLIESRISKPIEQVMDIFGGVA